eukprot:Phypoly_transcript_08139.p1 GENE.Phypoly_transcript_08139~~Phypoly_transcript_08139.p1  ORF type:complete len:462 (+),score=93.31 Phypoly_transcript_08139:162-1547(+)
MSIGVATINADLAVMLPELKKDMGDAVSTSFQDYDGGSKKWEIAFQGGTLSIYTPSMSGPSISRSSGAMSKRAGFDQSQGKTYEPWVHDVLTIMAEYYANSLIKWDSLTANTPSVSPTKSWPKDVLTKCFQRCLIHKNFDAARKYLKMGADPKKYIGEQSMDDPSYRVDSDHFPAYAENATVVHWACERPCLGSLKFMKEIGVWDLTAKDIGDRTPLHYLFSGLDYRGMTDARVPMMKMILEDPQSQTIVNATSKKGNTPLNAALNDNTIFTADELFEMIKTLLENSTVKVDLTAVNSDTGLTPSQYCAELGCYDSAELLDNYKGPTKAPAKPAAGVKPAAKPAFGKPAATSANTDQDDLDNLLANLNAGTTPAAKPAASKPAATTFGAKPAATPVGAKPSASPVAAKPAASSGGVSREEHEKLKKKVDILQEMLLQVTAQLPFNPALNKLVYDLQKLDKQ